MITADIHFLPHENAEKMEFDWGQLTWYASSALGNTSDFTVGRCLLKPGFSNPRHYHPNCSEALTVIQGTIRHTMANGEEAVMKEGDTVVIPANVWHNAQNIGENDALLFIVFSSADRETVGE